MLLIGAGFVVVLTIGVIALLSRDDDAPVKTAHPSGTTPSESEIATPSIPALEFAKPTRELVRTSTEPIKKRDREASERAATAAEEVDPG